MTQPLAKRLQQRLREQTDQVAELTESELTRLSERVKKSVTAELRGIETTIENTARGMQSELPRLRWIVLITWLALVLSLSLSLTGFLLWRSMQPAPLPLGFSEFQSQGENYLMLPIGSKPLTCKDLNGRERACLKMEN